jgi:hypothetical protein
VVYYQGIPAAELWLIPDTTHALRRRDAEAFGARVLDFLARSSRADNNASG